MCSWPCTTIIASMQQITESYAFSTKEIQSISNNLRPVHGGGGLDQPFGSSSKFKVQKHYVESERVESDVT